jgi:NitT/TauT family transport system substrate-binding protein
MRSIQTRRSLLTTAAMAGVASVLRAPPVLAADGALETTTVRVGKGSLCAAPTYLAEELLRAEGFTDVRYPDMPPGTATTGQTLGRGDVDFSVGYASQFVQSIEAGDPITLLAGIHVGCIELFGNEGIRGIADLKAKSVGVQALGSTPHVLLTLIAAQLGLDPVKGIHWVTDPKVKPIDRFVDGKIDAFLGFAPEPQELRARHIGHSILNTALDRPWSQYFCCMLGGNREFVRKYPVATKRVLRAFLKAADLCTTEPKGAAQQLVDRGFTSRYDYAVQALGDIPYDKWREYDPEDTIRFYALRLHEVGFIKSSPQKIIADSTDWRFLNELKRELKA